MFRTFTTTRLRNQGKARPRRAAVGKAIEALEGRQLMASDLQLSEVWGTPYQLSSTNKYIEISGKANEVITKAEFVQFDGYGGGTPTGTASYVYDLNNVKLGSNGLLLIEPQNGVVPNNPATKVIQDPNFNLGGGTEFYALFDYSATGAVAIKQNDSFDKLNTGTLDFSSATIPAGVDGHLDSVIDGVEFVYHSSPSTTDRAYNVKQTVGGTTTTVSNTNFYIPVGSITPDAATRELSGTYLTAGYTPSGYFSAGYTAAGSSAYETGSVFHAASATGAYKPTDGYALTPGGANNQAVLELTASTNGVKQGNTVTFTATVFNGTAPTGSAVTYTVAPLTATDPTNYTVTSNGGATTGQLLSGGSISVLTKNTGQTSNLQFLVTIGAPTKGVYLGVSNVIIETINP